MKGSFLCLIKSKTLQYDVWLTYECDSLNVMATQASDKESDIFIKIKYQLYCHSYNTKISIRCMSITLYHCAHKAISYIDSI